MCLLLIRRWLYLWICYFGDTCT